MSDDVLSAYIDQGTFAYLISPTFANHISNAGTLSHVFRTKFHLPRLKSYNIPMDLRDHASNNFVDLSK